MLRSLVAILFLLLCTNALADRSHAAKSFLPAAIGDMVEYSAGFTDRPDQPLDLPKPATISVPGTLATIRSYYWPAAASAQFTPGQYAIRAPPLTL
jgi:hypothetical protein